ncbi:hypothetical protein QE152_g25589 [Popillia japonica]|uniref:Chitin-binding type-2 domain-containing protein n=1 Tax=Popillia japonica TaxID=7064 RepID=A0AAW1K1E4_POPJA
MREIFELQNFCQINPGFSIHPRNCKFLLCTSDGRLLLGVCNANTYCNPNSKSCQNTPNCGHIQQQNQFGSANQENWQANTQYQYFRLVNIGNETYTLDLDHNFCQNNPGVSIHPRNCSKFLLCTSDGRLLLGICNSNIPRNCSKFLLCTSDGRLLLGICNSNIYYDPNSISCQNTPNCTHIQQQNEFGSSNQENWQANTQYQYFRLISIGNETYALGLDQNFCQINRGFSMNLMLWA